MSDGAAPSDGAGMMRGRGPVRCGFCGSSVDGVLADGRRVCPECGGELDPGTLAIDSERPAAARSIPGMLALLGLACGIGLGLAWLGHALSGVMLGEAPLGLLVAISLNGCWWLVVGPLLAMAVGDNLIRVFGLRGRLPLGGFSAVYVAVPIFALMVATAWPMAWPVLRPWVMAAPGGVAGPTAAPSAHQHAVPAPSPGAPAGSP